MAKARVLKFMGRPLDSNSTIRIYDIHAAKWVRRAPVDVREGMAVNAVSLEGPMINVKPKDGHPGTPRVICKEELATYLKNGYEEVEPQKTSSVASAADGEEAFVEDPNEPEEQSFPWSDYKVPELREFAAEAGIEGSNSLNKAQLIKALEGSSFRPAVEDDDTQYEDEGDDED